MSRLIHLIYSSTASTPFSQDALLELLAKARNSNIALGVTGMLLHVDGNFLQVIEGEPEQIDSLFAKIASDPRHENIVTIIREAIPRRAFSDWSMGFADVSREELNEMEGVSNFLLRGEDAYQIAPGRAKKLLMAFADGRWRSKSSSHGKSEKKTDRETVDAAHAPLDGWRIAFQPIVSITERRIWSSEALAWDSKTQRELTASDQPKEILARINQQVWERALEITSRPDCASSININLLPSDTSNAIDQMKSIIDIADRQKVDSRAITLELNQDYLSGDLASVIAIVQDCKESGLSICLDNFGAGRSGLNQLEMSQPNSLALNEKLVREVDANGAKQAIIRGLIQTCDDLAIDVIAKYVETEREYHWLAAEGIELFQGGLFAHPHLDKPTGVANFPESL